MRAFSLRGQFTISEPQASEIIRPFELWFDQLAKSIDDFVSKFMEARAIQCGRHMRKRIEKLHPELQANIVHLADDSEFDKMFRINISLRHPREFRKANRNKNDLFAKRRFYRGPLTPDEKLEISNEVVDPIITVTAIISTPGVAERYMLPFILADRFQMPAHGMRAFMEIRQSAIRLRELGLAMRGRPIRGPQPSPWQKRTP